ncbi:DUF1800 domain-containing protein [SAR202 cluster bacterium AD-804-J14_MRT_500m]|nr:DUF1800 domain-containing protein [SAR202 cluster bacterium AD-804-J14_MRT_500m]
MSNTTDLIAHLMRRAGFGATREEIERLTSLGYERVVEELLDPDTNGVAPFDESIMFRHQPGFEIPGGNPTTGQCNWMYRMIVTPRPLEEKMTLFWHHVFATGNSKVDNCDQLLAQTSMLRKHSLGNYRTLLVNLAKDPAMIFWLDNNQNHKDAPNENWGRELLELFTMGQGHYTEDDVKMASRAFTGWNIAPKIPRLPYGRFPWEFEYISEDHDDGEKIFLGNTGRFNGEDIIDIILQQPATSQFLSRHLYNFFVADEVQVPSWLDIAPKDPSAIEILSDACVSSNYDMQSVLRTLFNSDFFKDESVWYSKVKSPAEVVAGTMRLVGDFVEPKPYMAPIGLEPNYQGQALLDPPSVEGWHTGQEWIDSGSLVRRINFVADRVGDVNLPGVQAIIDRLAAKGNLSASDLIDNCLELMGPVKVNQTTFDELIAHAETRGLTLSEISGFDKAEFAQRVGEILQLVASTREYQFA